MRETRYTQGGSLYDEPLSAPLPEVSGVGQTNKPTEQTRRGSGGAPGALRFGPRRGDAQKENDFGVFEVCVISV